MNALILALALSAQPSSASTADDVVAKAFAEDRAPVAARPAPEPSGAGRVAGWGLALAAVGAVVVMALKRRGQKTEAGFAEVAQNVSVGPKRSLLVVHFGGQRMLVGSTEAGFTVLSSQPLMTTEFDELVKAAQP